MLSHFLEISLSVLPYAGRNGIASLISSCENLTGKAGVSADAPGCVDDILLSGGMI